MNGTRRADSPGRVVSFGQVIVDLTIRVEQVPQPGEDVYADRAVERAGGLLVLAPYPHTVGNRRADSGDEGRRLPIVPNPDEAVVPAEPVPVGRLPGHVPSRRRRGRLPGDDDRHLRRIQLAVRPRRRT